MEKTRVPKGEEYWYIDTVQGVWVYYDTDNRRECDDELFASGNYFSTLKEAKNMANKICAVLNGADVIKMPNDVEIGNEMDQCFNNWDPAPDNRDYSAGFGDALEFINSKIIK